MCAEMVILHHAAPVRVDHLRPFLAWADAVFPMIFISETTTRPAQDGKVQLFQCRDHIIADPASIWDGRIFTNPNSLVDTSPEMLGELAVDVAIDRALWLIGVNRELAINRRYVTGHGVCRHTRHHDKNEKLGLHANSPGQKLY